MKPTKLKTLPQLTRICTQLKAQNQKIITTNGCFDLLHPGHIRLLQKARSLGDVLIVALNGDQSVESIKGIGRPIYSQEERAVMVAALEVVNYVVIFSEAEPSLVLAALKPHIHIKGRGYQPQQLPEYPVVIAGGGKIEVLEAEGDYSTSGIISRLKGIP
ncbi:MAG: adenylyltransferase/cytidyltransferase family protein [Thermincolia bacterium]